MNKKTKLAILISAVAAVVSAVILIIVFWDKLLSLCPCKKKATDIWEEDAEAWEEEAEAEAEVAAEAEATAEEFAEEAPVYSEEEQQDFADLEPAAEEE